MIKYLQRLWEPSLHWPSKHNTHKRSGGGGGGGGGGGVVAFSSRARIFLRIFNNSFPVCAFFFFLKWRLARVNKFHSFGQGQSTVVQWAETTVTKSSLTACVWAHFHSDFVVPKVHACLGVTCHLHFWQNDRGLLHATAVTQGWNRHRVSVSTQSWLEKKILLPHLLGFEHTTFQSEVRRSNKRAIPAGF